MVTKAKIKILSTGSFVDDRGVLSYLNDFEDFDVKRMYIVENFFIQQVRAWHGHILESKIIIPICGTFVVGIANFETTESRIDRLYDIEKFIISDKNKTAIFIPAMKANGFMNLNLNAKLLILSNRSLDKTDDFRCVPHSKNSGEPEFFWHVLER